MMKIFQLRLEHQRIIQQVSRTLARHTKTHVFPENKNLDEKSPENQCMIRLITLRVWV